VPSGKVVMKKTTFIALFVGIHVTFVFLQIHKQSIFIGLSFEKQRLEKRKDELMEQKDQLSGQLYALNDQASIKHFALTQLNMKSLSLHNLITCTNHE
jgi:uncharacterized membrane-anchored protein YhcB (DUF1043 family)